VALFDREASIFWPNAQGESTLKATLAGLAAQLMGEQKSASVYDSHEEERMVQCRTSNVYAGTCRKETYSKTPSSL
jgi:hypothetical protein